MTADLVELDFTTDDGFGPRARIGLIVLETDHTIEPELHRLELEGVSWYRSRIPMEPEVTPTTLTDMKARLPVAAGLLPAEFAFDAIGYGCTSAATLIGADGVEAAIRTAHPDVPSTNPISAAIDAFDALGVGRIAVVTPYTADVTRPVADMFRTNGIEVATVGSFLESSDHIVASITEASVAEAVRRIAAIEPVDGIFVSCTSLRTFGIAERLEEELGIPVVSSNLALGWKLLRLAGIDDPVEGLGRLYRSH